MTDKPIIGHYATHPDVGETVSKSQVKRLLVQAPDKLFEEIERLRAERDQANVELARLRRVVEAVRPVVNSWRAATSKLDLIGPELDDLDEALRELAAEGRPLEKGAGEAGVKP